MTLAASRGDSPSEGEFALLDGSGTVMRANKKGRTVIMKEVLPEEKVAFLESMNSKLRCWTRKILGHIPKWRREPKH